MGERAHCLENMSMHLQPCIAPAVLETATGLDHGLPLHDTATLGQQLDSLDPCSFVRQHTPTNVPPFISHFFCEPHITGGGSTWPRSELKH